MPNGSVRGYIDAARAAKRYPDSATLLKWTIEVAKAMEYLHANGVVHGDLHGGNVLLDEHLSAVVSDFGFALIASGTPGNYSSLHGGGDGRYSAPELLGATGPEDACIRPTALTDVYAYAVTLFEIHMGEPVFALQYHWGAVMSMMKGQRPELPAQIPSNVKRVIRKGWAHDARERWTMARIVDELSINMTRT
ncbi:hypothetical protein EUX98_g5010 [Antrodiella citrinella]|uniref:Protein kinase domain-containing protein n=1 Tax=Antrodiella citrinella TaxID=2447956 RepID=A0A4S4MUE2_9APHY|nr:hypothetical protein EUX98_g5010 [Antrodiella citrinella]